MPNGDLQGFCEYLHAAPIGSMLLPPLREAVEPSQCSCQDDNKKVPSNLYLLLSKSKTHNGFVLYCNNHLAGTSILAGRKYCLIKISSDWLEKREFFASLFF